MSHKKLNFKLRKHANQNRKKENDLKYLDKVANGLICMALCLIVILCYAWHEGNKRLEINTITSIEGTLKEDFKINYRRKKGREISIFLNEYPNINFKVGTLSVKETNVNLLIENVHIGEKLMLDILISDKPKLNQNKSSTIQVIGIRDYERAYFSIIRYNKAKTENVNSIGMLLLLIFSFSMLIYGFYVKFNKNPDMLKQLKK